MSDMEDFYRRFFLGANLLVWFTILAILGTFLWCSEPGCERVPPTATGVR